MKKGKLIEFKSGLYGINFPNNLGIVIKKRSRKKETILDVFTTKGIREIKGNHVTKRKFPDQIEIPPSMKSKAVIHELKPRLEHFIEKYGHKTTDIQRKRQKGEEIYKGEKLAPSTDRELWDYCRKKEIKGELTSKELAMHWFQKKPTTANAAEIEEVLEVCTPHGMGYFNVKGAKPRRWNPISFEDYEAATQEISRLRRLRERLVEVDEIEDEEGNKRVQNIPVALYVLNFTKEEKKTLENCQRWMEELIMHKEFIKDSKLLGGTSIYSLGKFNLRTYLQFLADDWTESRFLLQPASAMTEYLLRTEYWNESTALENITIRAIKENLNFTWDLDEKAQELALEFPNPTEEQDEWKRRKNLCHLTFYTIDPSDAKDFDQALAYEKHNNGYTLFVACADVTHYVTPDSYLDHHAKQRATSVYLPHRVLPMHPPALSTGLCALQEKVPRFAVTVKLDFSPDGDRTNYEIYESIVEVEANLAYEYVDEKLSEHDPYWIGMLELGNKIRNKFNGLNVETKEARMTTSQPTLGLKVEEATVSMQMNEMFMVATNEAIGEFIRDSGHIGIYRCHPIPDQEDVNRFNDQMAALGIDYRVEIPEWPKPIIEGENSKESADEELDVLSMLKKGGKIQMGGGMLLSALGKDKEEEEEEETGETKKTLLPGLAQLQDEDREKWMKPFREVLARIQEVEDKSQRMVMHLTTLGMFGRAFYTPDNIGHFGLGSACYTHFTAPIRRYSDDIAHRLVKGILSGTVTSEHPLYTEEESGEFTEHCTEQTISAEKLERQVVGAGLAFMTRRSEWQGKIDGVVTKILPRGFFLLLREVVEGKIRMTDFTRDEVIVDPSESIAFRKKKEGAMLRKIFHAEDWQEMLDEEGEPIEVLIRLGQKVPVRINARDYVEGNVSVVPASFSSADSTS
ncbi:MAG: RNB domain-containing ribonuclease [Candidatus Hodarchaeota archaeon]